VIGGVALGVGLLAGIFLMRMLRGPKSRSAA